MPRILLPPLLCIVLAGCNADRAERRAGADLTQDPGQCAKFSWGTPEMAQCLDAIAATRAASARPVAAAQPAEPPVPQPAPQPALAASTAPVVAPPAAPNARAAAARGRAARAPAPTPAPVAEPAAAAQPEAPSASKSWWPWPLGGTKSETEN